MTIRAALETAVLNAMDVAAETPMQWGKDDCALWCANIVRDALGYDAARIWRGRYTTRRGAMFVLGGGDLLKALRMMARRHKWKRIDPRLAQPGDVGMTWTEHKGRPVLATVICRARGWFVGRADNGVSLIRADRVAIAWSVLPDALPDGPGPRVNLRIGRPQVAHEPVSTAIGLTSLIAGFLGTSAAVGGVASLIGGAIVAGALSPGVSLR